jgi:hypothetical protein
MYGERLSRSLSSRRAIRRLRALKEKHIAGKVPAQERLMDIIAIQIIATAALLVAHLVVVVRNRFTDR